MMAPSNIFRFAIAIASALVLSQLLMKPDPSFVAAAVFLVILPVFFLKPEYYFIFFILIRPVVDLSLRGKLPGNKLSALVVIPLILLCVKDFLLKPEYIQRIRESRFLRRINFLFFLILITYALSFVNTNNRMVSAMDFVRFFSLVISVNYAVVYFAGDTKRREQFINLVLLSSAVPLFFGFLQLVQGTGIQEKGHNRIYGSFAHSNVYAEYLVMLVYVAFHAFKSRPKGVPGRKRRGFVLGLALVSLYLTQTRTLWIAFAFSILVYVVLKRGAAKKLIYLGFALIFLAGGFFLVRGRFEELNAATSGNSLEWRLNLWKDRLNDLKNHPVLGNGLGMFEYEVGVMAHNDFIRVAYESGIPSSFLFLMLFVFLFFYAAAGGFRAPPREEDYFNTAAALVAALFVAALAVNTLRSTVIMFYYLCVVAVFVEGHSRKPVYESPTR